MASEMVASCVVLNEPFCLPKRLVLDRMETCRLAGYEHLFWTQSSDLFFWMAGKMDMGHVCYQGR
jgi:hypothetical protein